jgi:ABC-type bacteriocin/lantibiotic exporter with double-glycine peptidase domain
MPVPSPLRQEKSDNCAVTCLRMVLSAHGIQMAEASLEARLAKQPGGVFIGTLAAAAESFGLQAHIAESSLESIASLLAEDVFPIVYVNRVYLDRHPPRKRRAALRKCVVHAVVPVRVTARFVIVNDPLVGRRRRVSQRKFEQAQRDLGYWPVVCRTPGR